MERLDLRNFHFTCSLCGKCCSNVLRTMETEVYAYNYQGHFTQKPEISVTIPYTELSTLKENIRRQYELDLKVYPQDG